MISIINELHVPYKSLLSSLNPQLCRVPTITDRRQQLIFSEFTSNIGVGIVY